MSLCGCFSKRTRNPDAVFLKGCEGDQLSDFDSLLNSPSEQLGQGCFGNTYRVYLEDGTTVTLKRLKGTFSRKNGFKDHMETVRRINHENLVGLEAYFCSRNDTFLVYDYLGESSSVASLLHGNNGQNRHHLDWEARVLIAIGAAKGINRIYRENEGSMVHGNIKTSNIFVNPHGHGIVSEFGIASIMSPLTPAAISNSGSYAPEVKDTRNSTQSADVFSFGVVLLELLTGRPAVIGTRSPLTLAEWIQIAENSEWSTDLLDAQLPRSPNLERELLKLLCEAISCVRTVPNERPTMSELVLFLEDILHQISSSETSTPVTYVSANSQFDDGEIYSL